MTIDNTNDNTNENVSGLKYRNTEIFRVEIQLTGFKARFGNSSTPIIARKMSHFTATKANTVLMMSNSRLAFVR